MNGQFLMTFKYGKIVPVAFVITEKQILAVYGIDILPIFHG